MAFIIYQKEIKSDKQIYIHNSENYKLAGWGLINSLWAKKGRPVNIGWTLSADNLLKEHNETYSSLTHSLVIDFHPNSTERIGLIEIETIHLFTYGNGDEAFWTPMMLELRKVFYNEDYENLSQEEKQKIISKFDIIPQSGRIFEFLYLNGEDKSWNWGKNGMTNAAFIEDDSRKYFSKFFASE